MVFDDFTPSRTLNKRQRQIRIRKYILELSINGNTEYTTTDLIKLKMWLMGLLVIEAKEFNEALESLKEANKIKVVGGMIITDDKL